MRVQTFKKSTNSLLFEFIRVNTNKLLQENLTKNITNIIFTRILSDWAKTYDVFFVYTSWNHVQFSRCVDRAQKLFIQLVVPLETEANQAELICYKKIKVPTFINIFVWYKKLERHRFNLTLTSLHISNRLSVSTCCSNRFAKTIWWRMYDWRPEIP